MSTEPLFPLTGKRVSKPDGTPRELMSTDKLRRLGCSAGIGVREGFDGAYQWFLGHGRIASR